MLVCDLWDLKSKFYVTIGFVEPKKKRTSCKFKIGFEGREFVFMLKEMRNGLYNGVSSYTCQHKDFCKEQFVNTMQRSTYLNNVSKS